MVIRDDTLGSEFIVIYRTVPISDCLPTARRREPGCDPDIVDELPRIPVQRWPRQ